jgi:hypothetical protein
MADSISDQLVSLLDVPLIARIRRNHGLEHATLHVLAERGPRRSMAGHSDLGGFWIVGDLSTEELESAVIEALQRLRDGEHELAIHPNCGTNFAVGGVLAGGVAALAMFGAGRRLRDKFERVPLAITLATLALMFSQPIGLLLQERITTTGYPDALEIEEVVPKGRGQPRVHRVVTRG